MFLPPPFNFALNYVCAISQINSIVTQLSLTVYIIKIGGIGRKLWPFSSLFFHGGTRISRV